jgi:formate hydrogenlyase subunit 3/multisubunit Na+/H+ antiporter MnhD subunit
VVSAVLVVSQVDIKKLLAFSRVMHLNLGLLAFLTNRVIGAMRFVLIRFSHGLVRRVIFYLGSLSSSARRVLYYLKGFGFLLWLIVLVVNAGLPPFISFLSEVALIISAII